MALKTIEDGLVVEPATAPLVDAVRGLRGRRVRSLGRRSGGLATGSLSLRDGLALSSDVLVEAVEAFGRGAVEVEPPVADEVLLVEDGSVGAEEGVLGQAAQTVSCAHMESLAFCLGISVVTSFDLTVADESGFWDFSEDWVVCSGLSWHRLEQPVQPLVISGMGFVGLRSGGVEGTVLGLCGWGTVASGCLLAAAAPQLLSGHGGGDGGES